MEINNQAINDYIRSLAVTGSNTGQYREVLADMEDEARRRRFPIIGPVVGVFLRQVAVLTGAERIFEMGSGFGYSAMWFAQGLADGGKIYCTDRSGENRERALAYMARAGFESRIDFRVGEAVSLLREHDGHFDIIFNDIDKDGYPDAFQAAIPRLRKGALFITDNVLWSGRIFDDNPGESTRGVIEFNRLLFESDEIFPSIIPIRDGLGLAVKVK
jgi:caffeoyl-CoA O-methyltransferase